MSERLIQDRLYRYLSGFRQIVIPNSGALGWEADLLVLTPSHFLHEYEIKTSRADLVREFRTTGHNFTKILKHERFSNPREAIVSGKAVPNSITFVLGSEDIKWDDIPQYCGVMVLTNTGFQQLRKPLYLHRNKASQRTMFRIGRGLSARYWVAREFEAVQDKLEKVA